MFLACFAVLLDSCLSSLSVVKCGLREKENACCCVQLVPRKQIKVFRYVWQTILSNGGRTKVTLDFYFYRYFLVVS